MRHQINVGASVLFALMLSLSFAASAATTTLTVTSPVNGATVSGMIAIAGTSGSSIKNVRAYLGNTPISPDVTPSGGNYSLPVGTTQLPNNATDSITVSGFTVPAGQSGGTRVNDTLSLVVRNLPPSPSDTVITAPSTAAIIDAGGNSWTITGGGQIAVNGKVDTITKHVIELAYVNGVVWQENASSLWWYETAPGSGWQPPAGTSTSPLSAPPPPVNGACGSSSGESLSSAPTSGLCGTGSASTVAGTGPWTWSCAGSNGGTTAQCSASLAASPVNGACGSSNGESLTAAPTTGLCSAGTTTAVTGTGPWAWSCTGSNGGSNASCAASLAAPPPPGIGTTIAIPGEGTGTTYYVNASTGSDGNNGTSAGTAWKTITHAASTVTIAGSVVEVMNGTYSSFKTTHSGTASAYITYEAYPGASPVIQEAASDWEGIEITADYIAISGFTVVGMAASDSLSKCQGASLSANTCNDAGIQAGDYSGSTTWHHIIIEGNTVYNAEENGIDDGYADYVWIAGNIIHDNSNWSPYAGSGISLEPKNYDSVTTYKTFVVGNLVYNNKNLVNNTVNGSGLGVTDGEGIILDSSVSLGYTGRVYIANNITWGNGSAGIQVGPNSAHADVVNNTTYQDNTNIPSRGEITGQSSTDTYAYNNVVYGRSGASASAGFTAENYNDFYIVIPGSRGANDITTSPLLTNPTTDFHLQATSPCFLAGTATDAPTVDFAGNPRPSGGGYTIGAYQ